MTQSPVPFSIRSILRCSDTSLRFYLSGLITLVRWASPSSMLVTTLSHSGHAGKKAAGLLSLILEGIWPPCQRLLQFSLTGGEFQTQKPTLDSLILVPSSFISHILITDNMTLSCGMLWAWNTTRTTLWLWDSKLHCNCWTRQTWGQLLMLLFPFKHGWHVALLSQTTGLLCPACSLYITVLERGSLIFEMHTNHRVL